MKKALIIGVLVMLVGTSTLASVGIGAKFLNGSVPFLTAEFGGESLGVELGVGLNSMSLLGMLDWTMLWYSAIGRLSFPMGAFAPYVGLGGIGMSVFISSDFFDGSESASAFGATGEGGLRFSFKDMGVPLAIFAGVNVTWVPMIGLLEDIGYSGVGMGWHIGAVIAF